MRNSGYVVLEHARFDGQARVLEEIAREGICPFCPENLPRYFSKVLWRGQFWVVVENNWPYVGSKLHLLLILVRHLTRLAGLSRTEWEELLYFLQIIEEEERLESGALGLRFGDPNLNGGTVNHLHLHLIVADPKPPDSQDRLRFAMGPKTKK